MPREQEPATTDRAAPGAVWLVAGPAAGGLRVYVAALARGLAAAGAAPVLWTPDPGAWAGLAAAGVTVRDLSGTALPFPAGPGAAVRFVRDPGAGGAPEGNGGRVGAPGGASTPTGAVPRPRGSAGLRAWITGLRHLRAAARQEPPALVHAHGLRAALLVRAALPEVPLVTTLHTYPEGCWQVQLARWVGRRSAALVTVSHALARWAVEAGVVPAGRRGARAGPRVLPPPLVREGRPPLSRRAARRALALPEVGPVIGTVARLSREKGVDVLLRAVALLRRAGHPVTCVVIGDGPEGPALRRLAARLGAAPWVRWAGARPDAARLLRAVDLYVQPSRREAFGLAAAEAMAAARPVVASRVGGLAELLRDGLEGRLVPPGDACALARVLSELLLDESQRQRLARAAAARASRWPGTPVLARQHLDLYAELAAPAPAAAPRHRPGRRA